MLALDELEYSDFKKPVEEFLAEFKDELDRRKRRKTVSSSPGNGNDDIDGGMEAEEENDDEEEHEEIDDFDEDVTGQIGEE